MRGEGLRRGCFYYGLTPSLGDSLSFTMADLPEREQAETSFDTLYHLAKKLEARHRPCNVTKVGFLTHDPHKGYQEVFYTGGTCGYGRTRLAPTRS